MTKGKKGGPGQPQASNATTSCSKASDAKALAEIGLDPLALAAGLTVKFSKGSLGDLPLDQTYGVLLDQSEAVAKGDLATPRAMLVGQAQALNAIFVEMARRAAANMAEYPQATELFMRLAFKAQAQSRSTIEALDRLTNGREQTVRHVHVDNRGGQAVIAENVQAGGQRNGKIDDQSHATDAADDGPALPGADPLGNGVPIPSREGSKALPHARRHKSRRAKG